MASITRANAQSLIPEDVTKDILGSMAEQSATLPQMRRLRDMSAKQLRMPVWENLPTAFFVDGDTGRKQTTSVSWKDVFINAEKLAIIVPIPEVIIDDVDYDIWEESRPAIVEAFGIAIDQAILYGTNKPALWPDGVVPQAIAKGNTVTAGGVGLDLYDDLLGEGGVISQVEEDGYMVSGHVADLSMRSKFRGLPDNDGRPIFASDTQEGKTSYSLDGESIVFPRNGAVDPTEALLVSGDWSQAVYSVRTEMTWKLLTEATLYNADESVMHALAQDDMVAMRIVFRLGWALPNPINRVNENDATRFPFAVYEPAI